MWTLGAVVFLFEWIRSIFLSDVVRITKPGLVWFCYIKLFGFLVFILDVVDLVCQYHSQVIGWKDSREITCYVSSEMLNSTYSLTE